MALADGAPEERGRDQAGPLDALAIGFAQAFALAPGVSRNGATLTAARAAALPARRRERDLPPDRAAGDPRRGRAEGRAARTARRSRRRSRAAWPPGRRRAFVSTLLSLRLITMLERSRSLRPYAAYRAALGAGALVALARRARMSDAYARAGRGHRRGPRRSRSAGRGAGADRHRPAEPLARPVGPLRERARARRADRDRDLHRRRRHQADRRRGR